VLREKNLPFELVPVDLGHRTPEFVKLSPLGKVPALVDEDGTVIFDSTVMVEYLEDRYPEIPMLGTDWLTRLRVRSLDELGDTLADNAVAAFMTKARGDRVGEERALSLAEKSLVELERRDREGVWPDAFTAGDAAVIGALGYFEIRLGRALLERFPAVLARAARHAARPSVAESTPTI
jgi:glutathione S-transferase